tara:strand:- start:215 stop:688 length:474 start_codon:yes stop_codon:yes gene_type:complete
MEIQGFPKYLIYQDGRVQNKKHQNFLKHYINTGYPTVNLRRDNKTFPSRIHRLIGIHYIPNPNNYPIIDHIDRNKQNNNIDNLRWVTHSINLQNKGLTISNTSGFKYISYSKKDKCWLYSRNYNGERMWKMRKDKLKLICYSFIQELKISLNSNNNI